MDVYSLINSKAISDHCRKIAHPFTPLETAYLVHANDSMSIAQKHAAFREIIREYPDTEVAERPWTPYFASLHDFLRRYMDLQNTYLSLFYKNEPGCVYSCEVLVTTDKDYTKDGRLYAAFGDCLQALRADMDELAEAYRESDMEIAPVDIRVTKRWINALGDEHPRYMTVCIDSDGNPMNIWDTRAVVSSADNEILLALDGLWPEIPTPFQRGDILVGRNKQGREEEPFVLDSIPYWEADGAHAKSVAYKRENGDCSDLITGIYGQDTDGSLWRDDGPSYLDMEYCERELHGTERYLLAISNYLKGELPLELLIRSYDILKAERHAKEERRLISCFRKELLEKAGLENPI